MNPIQTNEDALEGVSEKHDAYPVRVSETPARNHLLSLVRSNPNWGKVGPTHRPRIEPLVLGEIDAADNIVTARSKRELAERYNWTTGEVLRTLAALREQGIAYSCPQWNFTVSPPMQIGSKYVLVAGGAGIPQAKRALTPAQKRGAKRAAKTRRKRRLEAT